MSKPLVIELFCGMFGWSAGWLELGGRAVGFDIAHEPYHGEVPAGATLVLQDVLTLHGSQFVDADLILASPPCQAYSYMAMPFTRGKRLAEERRGSPDKRAELNQLFDACFRLQREACEAAGRHIHMVVENVRGAQPWVGPAKWRYGSFYLWGDVPALMPQARAIKVAGFRFDGSGRSFQTASVAEGAKIGGDGYSDPNSTYRRHSSRSSARKAASARIAKIPPVLSRWIAQAYFPCAVEEATNES